VGSKDSDRLKLPHLSTPVWLMSEG
jgi:hypothetical protein